VWVLPVLTAVSLHELAQGGVALRRGDDTALRRGRLTLNPLPHVDPFGTVLLPLFLVAAGSPFVFGWAKPVPVNFANLRNPKRDMVAVALAGPMTNVLLALICVGALHTIVHLDVSGAAVPVLRPVALMFGHAVVLNVALAVFNMIPVLPLDGGRVLFGLLPRAQALAFARLEPYGMLIVMALLFTKTLDRVVGPVVSLVVRALL
jgi:Zn-dependent protease